MTTTITKTCPTEGCTQDPDPKSNKGYCTKHMADAKAAFIEMVRASKAEREQREARWEELNLEAHRNGVRAGNAVEDSGMPGFAWIVVKPATCSFARWLVSHTSATSGGGRGVRAYVPYFGSSYEAKRAYAKAYADTVRKELGDEVKRFEVYVDSRID